MYSAGVVVVNSIVVGLDPGANPTTSGYNTSIEKIYNATGSLARFENRNIFFCFEKRCSLHTRLAIYVVVGIFKSRT
jgi:hypothetical protein